MKNFLLSILIVSSIFCFGQEKEIKTKVDKATVFLKSARVTRVKTIALTKGKNQLLFSDLSPFIDKKSVQIKAAGVEIEGIDFKKNYLKSDEKNSETEKLNKKIQNLDSKIRLKKVEIAIVKEEIDFLRSNRSIGGDNRNITVTALKETSSFYGAKMKSLKTRELKLKEENELLVKEVETLTKQLKSVSTIKNFGVGEIRVKLNSDKTQNINFEISYNVDNIGWYPSYDIRVKDISSPLKLIYKANLKQNSKVDWSNVKLTFSSANPDNTNKVQKIIPYFLNYGTYPPSYEKVVDNVSGVVSDENGPLPGVSIMVKGTTIGTETDFDGNYSIKIPKGKQTLVYSYLGYETQEREATNKILNIELEEDSAVLDEVVVVGYGTSSSRNRSSNKNERNKKNKITKSLEGKVSGITIDESLNNNIETIQVNKQTTVNFEIVKPYSIKSSNQDIIIPMKVFEKDVEYEYFTFPKVNSSAYLIGKLSDWESLNLLEGEANIYFEDTFIGSSLLNSRNADKELEISLGVDKNVVIERKKEENFTTRQFIGNKQEISKIWNYSIKNNKSENLKIVIIDQIPISSNEDIKIELDTKVTNGVLNNKTGEVKWTFLINSGKSENFKLKYSVRYPKNRILNID